MCNSRSEHFEHPGLELSDVEVGINFQGMYTHLVSLSTSSLDLSWSCQTCFHVTLSGNIHGFLKSTSTFYLSPTTLYPFVNFSRPLLVGVFHRRPTFVAIKL
jgi:hypothetical protein